MVYLWTIEIEELIIGGIYIPRNIRISRQALVHFLGDLGPKYIVSGKLNV